MAHPKQCPICGTYIERMNSHDPDAFYKHPEHKTCVFSEFTFPIDDEMVAMWNSLTAALPRHLTAEDVRKVLNAVDEHHGVQAPFHLRTDYCEAIAKRANEVE